MKKRKKIKYPTITREKLQKTNLRQKLKQTFHMIVMNKFTIAIAMGLFVGSIFGFTSLYIIKDDRHEATFNEVEAPGLKQESQSSENENNQISLAFNDLYVIQIGLFHERENAEMTKNQLEKNKLASFIWEREGEYYVLHSIYESELEAKKMAETLDNLDVDSFIKQWDMFSISFNATEAEQEWLQKLVTLSSETLENINNENKVVTEEWQAILLEKQKSELITRLQEKLKDIVTDFNSEKDQQVVLMKVLFLMEESIK